MAATGILPTYQRYMNGAPMPSSARRSFRSKEKYLILLVFLTFGVVCFGALFFLPEFKSGSNTVNSVYSVYKHMQKAGPELLIPAPPHGNFHDLSNNRMRHHDNDYDPHIAQDEAKLKAKIDEDWRSNIRDKVLEKPDFGLDQMNVGSSSMKAEVPFKVPSVVDLSKVVTVPPAESDNYPVVQGGEDPDPAVREKRNKVKEMTKHAWDSYVRWAWGKNELRPLSKRPHPGSVFGTTPLGVTIVDGLDTLFIMGLNEEYKQGRDWVAHNLNVEGLNVDLSVFETNIRIVGGLISCFALTGDTLLRDKAEMVAKKLLPAFQTPTGIPNALVNFKTGASKNYGWASSGSSILSEFGTLHLEFSYLSDITGNPIYQTKVDTVRKVLQQIDKPQGLYPNYLNPKSGVWGLHHVSIGALGDSFYEYLLKAWLQSGREDTVAKTMFIDAMQAMTRILLQTSPGALCGLMGLAAQTLNDNHSNRYMEIAEGITNTCHESYDRSATKLGPESFKFLENVEAKAIRTADKYYILRPEVIESYFIMWRLTKKQKYRDWAWEAVQAIETYCRTPDGYSGIKNVYLKEPTQDDVQQSFFLAETLKYLYLIFSDDSLISLEEWVFNSEAHPLPIKNSNPFYRAKQMVSVGA
ncbi:unnamed protein product [Bemisia tabaci]|uniref:alpha-1,2-Mannosidase n=1 Tax=Bemisia tabaci TaxID=7038 RepID=A0A9P0AA71_BEMTA|nr:unnamed protein product [Bemisia tabaci]